MKYWVSWTDKETGHREQMDWDDLTPARVQKDVLTEVGMTEISLERETDHGIEPVKDH